MTRVWPCLCLLFGLSGPIQATGDCGPIVEIEPLLKPGRILLLGELHGTKQSPEFTLDVACHAARTGLPVLVGLELRSLLQPDVDAYLASKGTDEDRARLLSRPQWSWDYQDGRASNAMLELVDGLRRLRQAGLPVKIVTFDESGSGGGQQRERATSANLARAAATIEQGVLVVLAGNQHTRVTRGSSRNAEFEPMGYLLGRATSFERIVALNVAHGGGSAWVCAPACGVNGMRGHHGERRWAIEIDEATRPAGHQGWYHVGAIEASLPARFTPEEAKPARETVARIREAMKPDAAKASTSKPEPASKRDEAPLTAAEKKIQGDWQAYDMKSNFKTWRIRFDGRRFHAESGADDWYKGRITIRPDEEPAQMDFAIEDCRCAYADETSHGIFHWDGESIVLSAPMPGKARPEEFVRASGSMMRLRRPE